MSLKRYIHIYYHEGSGGYRLVWAYPNMSNTGHRILPPMDGVFKTRKDAVRRRRQIYDGWGMYPKGGR